MQKWGNRLSNPLTTPLILILLKTMSKKALKPIEIPEGVKVEYTDRIVEVKGPLGSLKLDIRDDLEIKIEDNSVRVEGRKEAKKFIGLTRSLILNMIEGVEKGFEKYLQVQGVGYRVEPTDKGIRLFLGFSHPVDLSPPLGVKIEVIKTRDPTITELLVKGIDKQLVGETAARIRRIKPPDVYKGKGIRYKGEYVRKKVGKRGVGIQA